MDNQLSTSAQLKIDYRTCASLIPYANNARKHPKAQIGKIASRADFELTDSLGIPNAMLV